MSTTIDEKVVEMRFDDEDFKEGVMTTVKYLDKLRKELKLDDVADAASKSFKNINRAAENINLESVNKALDSINYRMSTLGQVGAAAIQTLVNAGANLAKTFVTGTLGTVMTKGWARATNIDQASFTLKGLGLDVKQAMEDADYAVTDTAYGLDEAAKAASQLAASGIQLGDEMKSALLGISGTAAMTNSDFTSMANIFTTVAGQGRVMTYQLNQLSSRGLNAAASLAQYFADGLATEEEMAMAAQIYQDTIDSAQGAIDLATEAGIRRATTAGLITFETFSHAMTALYGEHAKEANSTYEGAYSNMIAALGRISQPWMQKFRYWATKIFNTVTPVIKEFKTAMDEVGTPFIEHAITNIAKMIIKIIQGIEVMAPVIRNLRTMVYKPFKLILNTMTQIAQKAKDVFNFPGLDQISDGLQTVGKFLRSIKLTMGEVFSGEVHFKWSDEIVDIFGGIFSIINMAITGVKAFFKLTAPLWKLLGDGLLKILEGAGALGRFLQNLNKVVTKAYEGAEVLNKISKINIVKIFKKLGKDSEGFFNKLAKNNKTFGTFRDTIANMKGEGLVATFRELKEEIGLTGIVSSTFLTILEKISNFVGNIRQIIHDLKEGLSFKDAFGNTDFGAKVLENVEKLKSTFAGIDILSAPMDLIKSKFEGLIGEMGFGGTLMANATLTFTKLADVFKKLGSNLSESFGKFKNGKLFASLSKGIESLKKGTAGFKFKGTDLQGFFVSIKEFGTNTGTKIMTAFTKMGASLKKAGSFLESGFTYFVDLVKNSTFADALKGLGNPFDNAGNKLMVMPTMLDGIKEKFSGAGESIKSFFQTTFEGWTSKDWIHAIETGVLTVMNASFIGLIKSFKDTFKAVSGMIGQVKTLIGSFMGIMDVIRQLGNNLGETILSFKKVAEPTKSGASFTDIAEGLKKIAAGILLITLSIAILAFIPEENLKKGVIAMGTVAGVVITLTAITARIAKNAKDDKAIRAATSGVLKMSAAIFLIGMALSKIAKQPMSSIIAAGAVVAGIVLILDFVMKDIFSITKTVSSKERLKKIVTIFDTIGSFFRKMATAILLMMGGVALAAGVGNVGTISAAGAVMIGMILTIFTIVETIAERGQDTRDHMKEAVNIMESIARVIGSIAGAMLLIAVGVSILSVVKNKTGDIASATTAMLVIMGAAFTMAMLASRMKTEGNAITDKDGEFWDKFSKAMMKIGAAFAIIAFAISWMAISFKSQGAANVWQAIAGLSAVMVMVGVMAKMTSKNTGKNLGKLATLLLSMSVMITSMAIMFKLLNGVKAEEAGTAILGIIGILGMLGLLTSLSADNDNLLQLSVTLLAMGGAIMMMAGAMKIISGVDPTAVIGAMAVIGGLTIGLSILMAVSSMLDANKLIGLGVAIAAFGATVVMVAEAMTLIADLTTGDSWRAFGQLAIMIAVFTGALLVLASVGQASFGTGILMAAGAMGILAAALVPVAYAMQMLGDMTTGTSWRSWGQMAAMIGILTVALAALAMLGPFMTMAGVGIEKVGKGVFFLAAALAAVMPFIIAWQGQMDVLAGELIVFLEELSVGLGTVGTTLVTSIFLILKNIIANITAIAPDIADGFWQIILAVVNGFTTYGPEIIEKVLDAVTYICNTLAIAIHTDGGIADSIRALGASIVIKFLEGMADASAAMIDQDSAFGKLLGFFGIDEEGLRQASESIDAASDDLFTKAEAWLEASKIKQEELKKAGENASLVDTIKEAVGLDDLNIGDLGSFLTGDDLTKGLTGALKDVDIDSNTGAELANKIKDAFPGTDIFATMGIEDADAYMQGMKDQGMGTGEIMATISADFDDATQAEESAEHAGSKIGKKFKGKIKKMFKDTDDGAKEMYAKLVKKFGNGSDEIERLVSAGGLTFLQGIQDKINNGEMTLDEGYNQVLTTLQTMTDDQAEEAERAEEEIYNAYEAKGKAALEGLNSGLLNEELNATIKKTASDLANSVAVAFMTALGEGSDPNGVAASTKMLTIGRNVLQGLLNGLNDAILNQSIKDKATQLGNIIHTNTAKELDENSPSKKMVKIGLYAGEGLIIGIGKTSKKVRKSTRKMAQGILKEMRMIGDPLGKKRKSHLDSLMESIRNFEKRLRKAKTDKAIKKWSRKVRKAIQEVEKWRRKQLGVKGKRGTAQIRLWEGSDDYKQLTEDLKEARKELKKTETKFKNDKTLGKNNKYSKMSLKDLNKEVKKLEKSDDKSDKKKAKRLKKYLQDLKSEKKEIKDIHKEVKRGYKKYWKEYWDEIETNYNDTFRGKFAGDVRKTFEVFGKELVAQVDIFSAEVTKSLNVFNSGAEDASDNMRILSNTIDKVTDALSAAYDTSMDLFSEFTYDWYNGAELLEDMKDVWEGYTKWTSQLERLEKRGNATKLVEYLKDVGFSSESLGMLNAYVDMSDSQIAEAIEYMTNKEEAERKMYLENMEKTVDDYDKWQADLSALEARGLDDSVMARLKDMGVEGAKQVRMLVNMTDEELARAEKVFEREATNATNAYFENIRDQFTTYNEWRDNIKGLKDFGKSMGVNLTDGFISEIKKLGVDGAEYVKQLYKMTPEQLSELMASYGEEMSQQSRSYVETMEDNVDDYMNYLSDMQRLIKSGKFSDALIRELNDMGYEGYDTVKKFVNMLDDNNIDLISRANVAYEKQLALNAQEYYANMENEVGKYARWMQGLNELESAGLSRKIIKQLMDGGVETYEQVQQLLNLNSQGYLKQVNKLFIEEQKANANSLLNTTRSNMSDWAEYYTGVAKIMKLTDSDGAKLSSSLINKIKDMGVDGLDYIREITHMTKDELKELNDYAKAEETVTKDNLLIDIRAEKKKVKEWGDNLKAMADKGFSAEVIQEIFEQGYENTADLVKAYVDMEPKDVAEINTLYKDAAEVASEAAKKSYIDAANKTTTYYADALRSERALYVEAGKDLNSYIKDGIVENTDILDEAAETYSTYTMSEMAKNMEDYEQSLKDKYGDYGSEQAAAMADAQVAYLANPETVEKLKKSGTSLGNIVSRAYRAALNEAAAKIQRAIYRNFRPTTGAGSTQRNIRDKFAHMADLCAESFANTLKNSKNVSKIQKAAETVARAALNAAKKTLGIHSPSKEFGYIADYSIDGFSDSMEKNAYKAANATAYMGQMVLNNAAGMITELQDMSKYATMDLGIQPIFDPDAAATGLAAIDEMINAKKLAVQSLSFDNVSDINALTTLNDSLNNLTTAITGMESYGERLTNIETLLGTYLPEATTDVYLDGDKISSHVENTIANNIVRRRAGW